MVNGQQMLALVEHGDGWCAPELTHEKMGRRALPRIDLTVDLSQHLFELVKLQPPLSASQFFPRSGKLHLEIGSGKGLFLRTEAAAHPDEGYIGCELAFKYARYAAYKLATEKRDNAVVIAGDAVRLLAEFIPADSLSSVHIYFPDPWWKAKHKKRRVVRESLCQDIQRALKVNGELHFWTDVEEYYQSALEIIRQSTQLVGPIDVAEPLSLHDLDFRTHFERRTRKRELPVYRARFVRAN